MWSVSWFLLKCNTENLKVLSFFRHFLKALLLLWKHMLAFASGSCLSKFLFILAFTKWAWAGIRIPSCSFSIFFLPLFCFVLFFNDTTFFIFRYQHNFKQEFITHCLSASSWSSLETPGWMPSGPGKLLLFILSICDMTFSTMISISYGSSESSRQKDYSMGAYGTFHGEGKNGVKRIWFLCYVCTFSECTFCSLIIYWSYRLFVGFLPLLEKWIIIRFCCMFILNLSVCFCVCVSISRAQPIWRMSYNIPDLLFKYYVFFLVL